MANESWQCHVCGTVYAWWVAKCREKHNPVPPVPPGHPPRRQFDWKEFDANFLPGLFNEDDGRRSERGYCYGVEDGLDGYCVHVAECRYVGKGWTGPNTNCVKPKPEPFYGGI